MSHEINETDRFGEVRSRGERAWHGLGDEIPEGLDAVGAFARLGLDWPTEMAPIQALASRGIINLPKHFAHVRKDNGDLLGIVTDEYKPFENIDLARLADSLAGADKACVTETAGSLYSGRRVFALVRLPHEIRLGKGGEDRLEQYVLVANGHGGFAETSCYPTSIRVVCANTLRMSEKGITKGIRFRHTGDFEAKVAQARLVLGTAVEESKKFETKVKALAATRLSKAQLQFFLEKTFEEIYGAIDPLADAGFNDRALEKRKEILDQWAENLEHEQQKIAGIAGTAWAAFNAISMYEDHQRGRFKDTDESDARVASNIFGVSHREKGIAFRNAMALVKVK
jgi:phage/plasmid-like protein (TIGR03299 family)